MGVHGLTTYLREQRRTLSETIERIPSSNEVIQVVVDGWSFIYALQYGTNLPWVYGGEYGEFCSLVSTVVKAWIHVGMKVHFVFDGATPEIKIPTVISRMNQGHVQSGLLFFRTSKSSRQQPRFLNEAMIIPPLMYSACVHALVDLKSNTGFLELYFADSECDPYAVELAARIGGYIIGNDSDYVILDSKGYKGYIPLSDMIWTTSLPEETESSVISSDDSASWQPVKKVKPKRKPITENQIGRGLLPPDPSDNLALSFSVYRPERLASHLKIPVTLLPLLGAFVGNDYTKPTEASNTNLQSMFFQRSLSLSQRIDYVAGTLRSFLFPMAQNKRRKQRVRGVMDLIEKTTNVLLSRHLSRMSSGEVNKIIDTIVQSALQSTIPKYDGESKTGVWQTEYCALHTPDSCPLVSVVSQNIPEDDPQHQKIGSSSMRSQYLRAYHRGNLSPGVLDILSTGSCFSELFLENPDLETVGRSIGLPIRQWISSILDDALGLPRLTESDETSTTDSRSDGDDDDTSDEHELVDVVESDDESDNSDADYLAPLMGELKRLHVDKEDKEEQSVSNATSRSMRNRPTVTTYYNRRGTRIAGDIITVPPLEELLASIRADEYIESLPLRSEDERLIVLLRILGSDTQSIKTLPHLQLFPILVLRWVVRTLHQRAQETGSKEREKEHWTRKEALCFLASFSWAPEQLSNEPERVAIEDRNIQLTAQVLGAMEAIEQLIQVLLLSGRVPSVIHLFSGKTFHSYLTGLRPFDTSLLPDTMWEIAEEGLDEAFRVERTEKRKNKTIPPPASPSPPAVNNVRKGFSGQSLFSVLNDLDS